MVPTKIRSITYGDLDLFKAQRLRTPTTRKAGTRSIASVHRELELLRRVLTIAVQQKWLLRNPFRDGEALIRKAEETQRERIATREEEERLLAACDDHYRREHLRPFLICAFDTGFRAGEIYGLRVRDVDFEDNCITAVSYKGKRRRERQFDMTPRLETEMRKLCGDKKPDDLLFGFQSVKRSFATAKRIAGLPDFRLHDTRHTATTRLISGGLSLSEAGKLMAILNRALPGATCTPTSKLANAPLNSWQTRKARPLPAHKRKNSMLAILLILRVFLAIRTTNLPAMIPLLLASRYAYRIVIRTTT